MNSRVLSHPVFDGPEARRKALFEAGVTREVASGAYLYRPGDEARAFYLVIEGEVEGYTYTKAGEVPVWMFGPGDSFGEYGLLREGDRIRASGVRARTDALLFEIPAEAFDALLADEMREGKRGQDSVVGPAFHLATGIDILRGLVLRDDTGDCSILSFQPGESVILEGEPGDAAYFVIDGEAEAIQGDKRLSKMTKGQCFGELAVLDGKPRTATVIATSPLVVLRIGAPTFGRWVVGHAPIRALVTMQRQLYRGPDGASVTMVSKGSYEGLPCVTTIVRYADGRRYSATKLTDRETMVWTELSEPAEVHSIVEHDKRGQSRRLHLTAERRIVKIEANGELEGTASLCARLIAKTPLKPAQETRFRWTGTLKPPKTGALLCACVGLTVEDAKTVDPTQIRETTGAGTICGSCERTLREMQRSAPETLASEPSRPRAVQGESPASFTGMLYRDFVEKVVKEEIKLPKASSIAFHAESEHPELFTVDNSKTAVTTLTMIVRLGITTALIVWCAVRGLYLPLVLLWLVQAVNFYGVSAIIHDMVHDAGFAAPWLNRVFGTLFSLPLMTRFSAFRESHFHHHRANQSFEDPKVSPPSLKPLPRVVVRFGHFSYDRVFMSCPSWVQNLLMTAALLLFSAPTIMTKYEFSLLRRIKNRDDLIDILLLVAAIGGAVLALGWKVAFLVLVPPLFIGDALLVTVFMTHASEYTINAPKNDPDRYELMVFNIQNLTLGRWLDRLGCNFHRYHVEHHLLPTVPFHRLQKASEFVQREYGSYVLPVRKVNFEYLKRGYLDNLRNLAPIDIAGECYYVGSWFDRIRYGQAEEAPLQR